MLKAWNALAGRDYLKETVSDSRGKSIKGNVRLGSCFNLLLENS